MYTTPQLVIKYLNFLLLASNPRGHGIHSPFVFDFLKNVLQDKTLYKEYDYWTAWRNTMLANKTKLSLTDIGAGSRSGSYTDRSVSSIAKTAAKSPATAKLFFRIVRYYKPETILELGTSLGLSSAFFSLARPTASIHTIEGVGAIAEVAKRNFINWNCTNVQLKFGNLDQVLVELLKQVKSPDLVFMDGNHQEEATKRYFLELLPFISNNTIIIVDDIRWSRGMENAWSFIQSQEQVRMTLDFFHFGIVLFRPSFLAKSHFRIRF
ncbi:MAG: class I SAM-dependent methyltransferase [Bacteroidetes bacterium]|nr:class I SAM-dependent methyltransferase [Bacteroidota bacterium]